MQKLYIELEKRYRNQEFERLMQELREEDTEVCELTEEDWRAMKEEAPHRMILTDRQETAARAKEAGVTCAGYEALEGGGSFYHVDMVIQGFEEVDAAFIRQIHMRHCGMPWVIAETERLLIRESTMDDFEALYAMCQEPGMTDYTPGIDGEREEARQLFQAYIGQRYPFFGYGIWTVVEKSSGQIIGRAGLENGTYQDEPVMELGYMTARKYQRRGYGMEAVQAVISYAFSELEAERLYAFIDERNEPSLRLIEKAGFQKIEGEAIAVYALYRR